MKKIILLFCMIVTTWQSSEAQQVFVKNTSLAPTGSPTNLDYRPAGTYIREFNPDGVILYGTMGFLNGQNITGKAYISITKNDFDGNTIWSFEYNSPGKDVISHAIEDTDGNIIISGIRTNSSGIKIAFVSKIEVVLSLGQYSFNQLWIKEYGSWIPTDLFEIYHYGNGIGYVLVGNNNNGKSYVLKMDKSGSTSSSGYWTRVYEEYPSTQLSNVNLYSGVQLKSTIQNPENSCPPGINLLDRPEGQFDYLLHNDLVICGTVMYTAGSDYFGYLLRINMCDGSIIKDKVYTSQNYNIEGTVWQTCAPEHSSNEIRPTRFDEIIQIESGDLVTLGSDGVILRLSTDLNTPKWMAHFNIGALDGDLAGVAFDIEESNLGLVIPFWNGMMHGGGSEILEITKDGGFVNNHLVYNLSGIAVGLGYSVASNQPVGSLMYPPHYDMSIECDYIYHNSNSLNKVDHTSGYWDDLTHIKSNPLKQICNSELENREYIRCDQFSNNTDNVEYAQVTGTLNMGAVTGYGILQKTIGFLPICETNTNCTNDVCELISTEIVVCPDQIVNGIPVVLNIPNPSMYTDVLWSTGEKTEYFIEVTEAGSYYAYVVDANGCQHGFEYIVRIAEDINLQATVSNVTCFGANNGSICFTTDVNIVSAVIVYPLNGSFYYETVAVNSNSFCYRLLIATSQHIGLEPGQYSIEVMDENGCTASMNYAVQEPDQLDIVINNKHCENPGMNDGSFDIQFSGGVPNYLLSVSKSSSTPSFFAYPNHSSGSAGTNSYTGLDRLDNTLNLWTYLIKLTDGNGCYTSTTEIIDNCLTEQNSTYSYLKLIEDGEEDVNDVEQIEQLIAYPNPVNGILNIDISYGSIYRLTDHIGRVVLEGEFNAGETSLDLTNYSQGVYMLITEKDQIKIILSE